MNHLSGSGCQEMCEVPVSPANVIFQQLQSRCKRQRLLHTNAVQSISAGCRQTLMQSVVSAQNGLIAGPELEDLQGKDDQVSIECRLTFTVGPVAEQNMWMLGASTP